MSVLTVDYERAMRLLYIARPAGLLTLAARRGGGIRNLHMLKETVLDPLAMTDSTYVQPLPAEKSSLASAGHDSNGAVVMTSGDNGLRSRKGPGLAIEPRERS